MGNGVSTRDFGTREDAAVTDLETAGSSPDSHTLMGLTKGAVQRLGEIVDAQSRWFDPASDMVTGQIALSTTAKSVLAVNASRKFCEVKNADTAISVYIGKSSGVSSTNGHLLKAGEAFSFENYGGAVWAVAASGTPTVTVIEW